MELPVDKRLAVIEQDIVAGPRLAIFLNFLNGTAGHVKIRPRASVPLNFQAVKILAIVIKPLLERDESISKSPRQFSDPQFTIVLVDPKYDRMVFRTKSLQRCKRNRDSRAREFVCCDGDFVHCFLFYREYYRLLFGQRGRLLGQFEVGKGICGSDCAIRRCERRGAKRDECGSTARKVKHLLSQKNKTDCSSHNFNSSDSSLQVNLATTEKVYTPGFFALILKTI